MSVSQVLQHLCALEPSSPEFSRELYTFIRLDEKGEYSLNLQQSESARLVNFLDGALDVIPVTDALFRRCLRRLRHICGQHNVLPSSHIISESDGLRKTSDGAVAYGGFADVWEGMLRDEKVCVKVLRTYNVNANSVKGSLVPFYGEAVVWKRLRHPNVVPFLGVTTTPLQLVSKWMPHGTLTEYVNNNPHVDRISLLLDVAEGVNYLHTGHMLHGDLKSPNILIDGNGHACVSDFGLASIAYGKHSKGGKSDKGHTVRWSAPEVLSGAVPASKQADIFAFGMVVVETFTGNVPFHYAISTAVTYMVMSGERPPRPHGAERLGLSDALWRMAECCWQESPKERLKAPEVVDLLREMYVGSPSNSFVSAISGARRLVGSGPTTPQTDAALSPRLLDILQYREPTHKRTLSNTTPLNDDRRTVVGNPTSTTSNQISKQYGADGIMQRFSVTSQSQNGPSIPSPARSETPDTIDTDVFWSTAPTILHQENLGQVPKPGGSTLNSPESTITIPRISVRTADSVPSDASSFTVVDRPEHHHLTSADSTPANRRAGDTRVSRGVDDARNDRGDSGVRKVSDASSRRTEQQHEPPLQRPSGLSPQPIAQTPSRSSSMRKRGLGVLRAAFGRGSGAPKPPTRPGTPTAERGNIPKDQGRGGGPGPSDPPPQPSGAAKKGTGGWGRIRVVTKVLGLNKRHPSQADDTVQ